MRTQKTSQGLTVRAVAGTYVVILSFDLPKTKCKGLLGFSIFRQDHTENESYYMKGMKCFEATDPGFPAGSGYSTSKHPWQGFQWADYSAKPGHSYTYTIKAWKGEPSDMEMIAKCRIQVETETEKGHKHNVYFNRGAAASQEYMRRFGDRRPGEVENRQAWTWLSRGLYEALENFVGSCNSGDSLRIAAYEFHYEPFLEILADAVNRGVDLEIVYDAKKDSPWKKNRAAAKKFGLLDRCTERKSGKSYLSHNKFIVKLKNNKPEAVWTGGMNFSENGIFGHSNVAHLVKDRDVAGKFYQYWLLLQADPGRTDLQADVELLTALPSNPLANGDTVVFSPRQNLDLLDLYQQLALQGREGVFMTFAFGINPLFKEVYEKSKGRVRYALLEKKTRAMKKDDPNRTAEEKAIDTLRRMPENIFAIGDHVKTNEFDGWVLEKLSGLSNNVKYIHNKFMLVDPLGSDPVVIAGSANFSEASTTKNDENMLLVHGNKRVADIYFGEFMRMFTHFSFRESLKWRKKTDKPKFLRTNDDEIKWWEDYFGDTHRARVREFFRKLEV